MPTRGAGLIRNWLSPAERLRESPRRLVVPEEEQKKPAPAKPVSLTNSLANPYKSGPRIVIIGVTQEYEKDFLKYDISVKVFGLYDEEYSELEKHKKELNELSATEKSRCWSKSPVSGYNGPNLGSDVIYAAGMKYVNFIAQFGYRLKCFSPESSNVNKAFWTMEK